MDILKLFEVGMDRLIPSPIPMPEGTHLNLGAGNKSIPGAIALDLPEWDADCDCIPEGNETVAGIHAYHFLEHVSNPVGLLYDCQRVLQPGGVMNIVVPYYTSQMAIHDLDHKHYFCEETWKTLFANPYYDKNRVDWKFEIRTNVIMGIAERNLALVTQLVKGS